jgi:pantetheine-phosphate adenylyltransferase
MSGAERVGIFPGTFDPITNGHLDVIRRGRGLFDRFLVAVGTNPDKRDLFTADERAATAREALAAEGIDDGVEVACYEGLTVDYARRVGATAILRGLRNVADLNTEFQLALTNRAVADVETVFVMTAASYAFTSSSLIKQIAAAGDVGRLAELVPPVVIERLREKESQLRGASSLPEE